MRIILACLLMAVGLPLLGLGLLLVHVGVAALLGPEAGLAAACLAALWAYCWIATAVSS